MLSRSFQCSFLLTICEVYKFSLQLFAQHAHFPRSSRIREAINVSNSNMATLLHQITTQQRIDTSICLPGDSLICCIFISSKYLHSLASRLPSCRPSPIIIGSFERTRQPLIWNGAVAFRASSLRDRKNETRAREHVDCRASTGEAREFSAKKKETQSKQTIRTKIYCTDREIDWWCRCCSSRSSSSSYTYKWKCATHNQLERRSIYTLVVYNWFTTHV